MQPTERLRQNWKREKERIKKLRKREHRYIPFPSYPQRLNEYVGKGFKHDNLLAEYQILLSKYTDLLNSQK